MKAIFESHEPNNGTDLALVFYKLSLIVYPSIFNEAFFRVYQVLADAVKPDSVGKPETILVITDGTPDSTVAVQEVCHISNRDFK